MTQAVNREWLCDASDPEPVLKSQLDLAWPKPAAVARVEHRGSVRRNESFGVSLEQSTKPSVEEHGFFSPTFGLDCHSSLGQAHITYVQGNERAEPDAGAEEEREHRVVSFGKRAV